MLGKCSTYKTLGEPLGETRSDIVQVCIIVVLFHVTKIRVSAPFQNHRDVFAHKNIGSGSSLWLT